MNRIALGLCAAFAFAFAGWVAAPVADAQPRMPDLVIGDDAPSLDGGNELWKADPVVFEPGKVYAVEFWATWCKPCVERLPELDALQRTHADELSIVAVSDEPPATIREFLTEIDLARPAFTVVSDTKSAIHQRYLAASSRDAIPMIYIVGRTGRVEWIGHPSAAAPIVGAVLDGTWDPYGAESWARNFHVLERSLERAVARADLEQVMMLLDLVLDHYDDSARPVHYAAENATLFSVFRVHLLIRDIDPARGYSYARGLMLEHWDESMLLNNLAWFIVDEAGLPERDVELALQMSERANDLTDNGNAANLDTLARVHFELGDLEQALEWQRLAVSAVRPEENPQPILDALHRYETIKRDGVDPWASDVDTDTAATP